MSGMADDQTEQESTVEQIQELLRESREHARRAKDIVRKMEALAAQVALNAPPRDMRDQIGDTYHDEERHT